MKKKDFYLEDIKCDQCGLLVHITARDYEKHGPAVLCIECDLNKNLEVKSEIAG